MPVTICGPHDYVPRGVTLVNSTSRSKEVWSKALSPFFLGPVDLYSGFRAKNMENAWQFCKVYQQHTNASGDPTHLYWSWATAGWNDSFAHRYPMGKGAKPLFSLWDSNKLDYIEAREQIYIPLYKQAVENTPAFAHLKTLAQSEDVWIWDFDGYNHKQIGLDYKGVVNNPKRKMGHAFVLGMMLEGVL